MKTKNDSSASPRDAQRCKEAESNIDEADGPKLCPYFANIPSHLLTHILLQLPIKSLLICRCVCKNWKTLISESYFAKFYSDRASASPMIRTYGDGLVSRVVYLLESQEFEIESNNHVKLDPIFKIPIREKIKGIKNKFKYLRRSYKIRYAHGRFQIVNSCNGLLCLCHPSNKNILVICNPITGEFIKLPEVTTAPIWLNPDRIEESFGFGFQHKTNEYKIIKIWIKHTSLYYRWWFDCVTVDIHTLGTPSWRNVDVDPEIRMFGLADPTCVNDALYWINYENDNFSEISILCFDFESERLQSFPSPPGVFENVNSRDRPKEQITMGESNGFLYICDASSLHDVTMWIMNKCGIGESWTKVYNIDTSEFKGIHNLSPRFRVGWPVKHFEEGAAIWLYLFKSNCFIYYELEKHRFKIFRIHGINSSTFFEVLLHVPSLISLKDVVKGDNIEVLNIHSRRGNFKLSEEDQALSLVQEFVCEDISSSSCHGEDLCEEHTS